jgi:hypothetical protein
MWTGLGLVVNSCADGIEPSDSIKTGNFLNGRATICVVPLECGLSFNFVMEP